MFQSFLHLIWVVCLRTATCLGTTLPGIVAQVFVVIYTGATNGLSLRAWKQNWRGGLKRGIYALLIVWIPTYCVFTVKTVYEDHVSLVKKLEDVSTENKILKAKDNQCVVRNLVAPRDTTVPKSMVSAVQVIVVCARRYDPPYSLIFQYDQNLTGSGPLFFPIGGMAHFTGGPKDNRISFVVDAPTIMPNEPFTILAYGGTTKFPLLTKLTIKTASTVQDFEPQVIH